MQALESSDDESMLQLITPVPSNEQSQFHTQGIDSSDDETMTKPLAEVPFITGLD